MKYALKFAFFFLAGSLIASLSHAEPRTCQEVYNLGMEMGCSFSKADQNANSNPNATATPKDTDYIVRSTFGPTACKTQDLAKELIRDLKQECNSWLKERKTDLGSKYQTGTCSEDCSDCTMGLKRCSVQGEAHYAK